VADITAHFASKGQNRLDVRDLWQHDVRRGIDRIVDCQSVTHRVPEAEWTCLFSFVRDLARPLGDRDAARAGLPNELIAPAGPAAWVAGSRRCSSCRKTLAGIFRRNSTDIAAMLCRRFRQIDEIPVKKRSRSHCACSPPRGGRNGNAKHCVVIQTGESRFCDKRPPYRASNSLNSMCRGHLARKSEVHGYADT
jgi:hypothetical protein